MQDAMDSMFTDNSSVISDVTSVMSSMCNINRVIKVSDREQSA